MANDGNVFEFYRKWLLTNEYFRILTERKGDC